MTFASRRGLVLLALAALAGCSEPQSGIFEKTLWCPVAAGGVEVLDDMEDGDGVPCLKTGKWSVFAAGLDNVTPAVGEILRTTDRLSNDSTATTVRPSSFRALHLSGTVGPDGLAKLVLPLAGKDLSTFQEIDFWARSDTGNGNLQLRVALKTDATTEDDPFAAGVEITEQWGEQGNTGRINNVALAAFAKAGGQMALPEDRVSCAAIEFQFLAAGNPSIAAFGFWIDDIQIK